MTDSKCSTVKCQDAATKTLRIEHDYDSVAGETRTTVLEMEYCDQHADMWLKFDGVANTRYEVVRNG